VRLAGRHIVTEGIAPAYIDALAKRASAITVGNTLTEDVGLGPMINQRQLDRAAALLADAVADGATVVAGGTVNAPFFQPTVVTGVPVSSALWTEEIFAPIAPVKCTTRTNPRRSEDQPRHIERSLVPPPADTTATEPRPIQQSLVPRPGNTTTTQPRGHVKAEPKQRWGHPDPSGWPQRFD
jgi:hypothetical protein